MLYHGSVVGGLTTIWARSKSHSSGEKVAYFTLDRVYALVCCRMPTENFVTMGPDKSGKQNYYEADLTGPLVLVVGSEGKGMGRLTKEQCDFIVKMPMVGKINSLNASVAAGILAYEVLRQRTEK